MAGRIRRDLPALRVRNAKAHALVGRDAFHRHARAAVLAGNRPQAGQATSCVGSILPCRKAHSTLCIEWSLSGPSHLRSCIEVRHREVTV
jgi:hypothetical protein